MPIEDIERVQGIYLAAQRFVRQSVRDSNRIRFVTFRWNSEIVTEGPGRWHMESDELTIHFRPSDVTVEGYYIEDGNRIPFSLAMLKQGSEWLMKWMRIAQV